MKKIVSILLVVLPIILYYDFPFTNINIGTVASFLILLFHIFELKTIHINNISKSLFFVILYMLSTTLILLLNNKDIFLVNFIFVICNSLVVLLFDQNNYLIDSLFFIRVYKFVASFLIGFYLIQIIVCLASGYILPGKIFFLPLTESYSGISSKLTFVGNSNFIGNCSSLFSEPSHFSVFLLPLAHILIQEQKKNMLVKLAVISLLIILIGSANGILALIILFLCNLYFYRDRTSAFNRKGLKRNLTIIGFIFLLLIVYTILNHNTFFGSMFARLFTNDGNKSSKAGYRIYRGFYIYFKLPLKEKIFGIGFHQMYSYITANSLTTPYDLNYAGSGLEYANFISQFLIYFGIVPMLFFIKFISKFFKKGSPNGLPFLIMLVSLWFSSSMMFDSMFVFFMTFSIVFSFSGVKNNYERNSK